MALSVAVADSLTGISGPRSSSSSNRQAGEQTCTPAIYANIVDRFSKLKTGVGSSHQRLARFLLSWPRTPLGTYYEHEHEHGPSDSVFLTAYEFEKELEALPGQPRSDTSQRMSANDVTIPKWRLKAPRHFNDPQTYANFVASTQSITPGRILLLRGHPTPAWLGTIGSSHLVDPEFFRRWLEFSHADDRRNKFSLPTLPSGGWNLLELPIISIGKREDNYHFKFKDEIDIVRNESATAVRTYHNGLYDRDDGMVGSSVARDLSVFDHALFAIEQKITICMQPPENAKGWNLFVWTDAGDDLGVGMLNRIEDPASSDGRPERKYSLWPIIKYRPNMGLSPEKLSNINTTGTEQIPPCAARLHLELGHSLRMPLMADDPFYALTEIFAVAAASQNLLLNMIEHKLAQYTQRGSKDFDTLPNLTYLKGVLLRQMSQTKQTRHSIRNTEDSKWPISTAPAAVRARKMVEQDYDHIYEHAHELDRRCQEAITVLMSSVTIDDAKKAIAQTERVAKLTILAFVFVPLSFTTSFFGMNFRELNDLSISRWVAMTVPILLATLVVLLINVVRGWDLFVEKIMRTLR